MRGQHLALESSAGCEAPSVPHEGCRALHIAAPHIDWRKRDGVSIQMLSSGGEANEGLRAAGLPHRRAPLLIVLLIPLLACLGTATAAQGRYGLRGPAPSRALAADGRRLAATDSPTSVAEGDRKSVV